MEAPKNDPQSDFRRALRAKLPGLASRAQTQRLAAIRLFCVECMGGSTGDARTCTTRDCFLWPHRGANWKPDAIAPLTTR